MYIQTSLVPAMITNLILYQIWILIRRPLLPLVYKAIGWQQVLLLEISQPVSDAWGDGWSQTCILTSFQFLNTSRCSFPSLLPLSLNLYVHAKSIWLDGTLGRCCLAGIGGEKYMSIEYTIEGNVKRSLRHQQNWQWNAPGSLRSEPCT